MCSWRVIVWYYYIEVILPRQVLVVKGVLLSLKAKKAKAKTSQERIPMSRFQCDDALIILSFIDIASSETTFLGWNASYNYTTTLLPTKKKISAHPPTAITRSRLGRWVSRLGRCWCRLLPIPVVPGNLSTPCSWWRSTTRAGRHAPLRCYLCYLSGGRAAGARLWNSKLEGPNWEGQTNWIQIQHGKIACLHLFIVCDVVHLLVLKSGYIH